VLQCFWLALGSIAVWWGLRRGTAARAASAPLLSAVAFSLLMIVALEVQLVVTANTIGTHHTLIFWPFHHFLIAGAAALLLGDEEAGVNVRRVLAWTVTAVLTILVGSQLWVTSLYIRSYASGHGFHMSWDPAIYQLSDALNRRLDARSTVIFTDWGIATQLLALAQPEYRTALRDWWPTFNDLATAPESSRTWLRGQLVRPGVLIVTHSAGASVMKQARRNLQQFVQDEHLHLERLEAIDSVDGRPLYEILRAY
jgi:hypothetical protein